MHLHDPERSRAHLVARSRILLHDTDRDDDREGEVRGSGVATGIGVGMHNGVDALRKLVVFNHCWTTINFFY